MSFFDKVITKVFGKKSDKDLKKISPIIDEINIEYDKLSDLSEFIKLVSRFNKAIS